MPPPRRARRPRGRRKALAIAYALCLPRIPGTAATELPPHPAFGDPVGERNVSGVYTGQWHWDGRLADLPAGRDSPAAADDADAAPGAALGEAGLGALHRLLPLAYYRLIPSAFDPAAAEARGRSGLPSASERALRRAQETYDGNVRDGVCELQLSHNPVQGRELRGELGFARGNFSTEGVRRYLVRGEVDESGRRAAVMLVPLGLKGLVRRRFLNESALAGSFAAASAALTRFVANATLSLGFSDPAHERAQQAIAASMGPYSRVRFSPSRQGSMLWVLARQVLNDNPCVFAGDLAVRKTRLQRPLHPSHTETYWALHGTLVSLNCNTSITITASQDAREHHLEKGVRYLAASTAVSLVAVAAMVQQVRHASTQSTLAKLSWLSIANIAVFHQSLSMSHFILGAAVPQLFRPALAVSFLNALVFYMAMRHTVNVWEAVSMPGPRQRGMLLLTLGCATLVAASAHAPQLWVPLLPLLHTLWVPQVLHSVKSKAQKPVSSGLLWSQLLCRLFFVGYTVACPESFMRSAPHMPLFRVVAAWLLLQTAAVVLQRRFGPTFLVPQSMQPQVFDYHRPLPASLLPENQRRRGTPRRRAADGGDPGHAHERALSDMEAGLSDTSSAAPAGLECVICQAAIDISDPKEYMLPPCEHLFHTECLERWMNIKMECPVCRRVLP
eukprot:TRINITY_DN70664_c0_g1_i1.p1 TRINITY_DN70664_c0_g1~~TRINITY_DN70664_c0_g1_i1.p1  ORF type:complete len:697 (+),score=206.76 TRINITY_DN70664_c0_g1_i1:72-2093(+)